MNDVEKSRIRLRHWIDHNADHLKGYREVVDILEKEGASEAARRIRGGIELMERADQELEEALKALPDAEGGEAGAGALHSHPHEHAHSHQHSHKHTHEHSHEHGDSHEHRHSDHPHAHDEDHDH